MKVTMKMVVDYLSRKEIAKHRASKKDVETIIRDVAILIAIEKNSDSPKSRIYQMLLREGEKALNQQ